MALWQSLRGRLDPLKQNVVPHGVRAGRAERVALQDVGQHPKMRQQDLRGQVGRLSKVSELRGVHVVCSGVEGDELEACFDNTSLCQ